MRRARADVTALAAGAIGAAALIVSLVGFGVTPQRALFGWLFGWGYWVGLCAASVILLCILHTTRARWAVVVRRPLEAMAATAPLLAVLFLPVGLGVRWLYPWADPAGQPEEVRVILRHQGGYMNVPLFELRSVLYLVVWVVVAEALLRWSRRQDVLGEEGRGLTRRQRLVGAGALPAVALAMSFAALDWIMALDPRNHSSIFPLYWWSGSFLGAIALLALWVSTARGPGEVGELANASHRASLGKLLLGFTLFWLYVAYDQWLLVWLADLPGEAHWYVVRTSGGWGWIGWTLVIVKFFVPLAVLLSRRVKELPVGLALIAGWLLLAQALDLFWLVIPAVDPAAPVFHWTDASGFIAVGGLAIAFAHLRLRGGAAAARGDPYAEESVRYAGR